MKKTIKWGILGPGAISRKFVQDLKLLPDAEVIAVGSRSIILVLKKMGRYSVIQTHGQS